MLQLKVVEETARRPPASTSAGRQKLERGPSPNRRYSLTDMGQGYTGCQHLIHGGGCGYALATRGRWRHEEPGRVVSW